VVSLEFRLDDYYRERMGAVDPLLYDATSFRHIILQAQVRLEVNGIELLEWVGTPLFWMASVGLDVLKRLPTSKYEEMMIPEGSYQLSFEIDDGRVKVRELEEDRTATTTYDALREAWEAFAEEVRGFLLARFPFLARHPEVGAWFRGEEYRNT
jgi:hypothetical protein